MNLGHKSVILSEQQLKDPQVLTGFNLDANTFLESLLPGCANFVGIPYS